jgi:WD40 repeat protein
LLWIGGVRCAYAQSDNTAAVEAKPILVVDANGHTGAANRLLYWPYRNELISVSNDKTIRFWNIETGEPTRVLRPPIDRGDAGRLRAAAISPDNQFLAVGGESALRRPGDHAVYLIDPLDARVVRTLAGHPSPIRWVAFSPNGKQLATACFDEKIRLFDVATGAVRYLLGHTKSIVGLEWSPDGRSLISGGWDNTARIWDIASGTARAVMPHRKNVLAVSWSPDGKSIATGCSDRVVQVWNPNGSLRFAWPPAPESIEFLQYSPNSSRLLYGWGSRHNPQHGTAVLDIQTGAELSRYMGHPTTPYDGLFLPDGRTAVTDIVVWDSNNGSVVRRMIARGAAIFGVGWSRDDRAVGWSHLCAGTHGIKGTCPLEQSFCLSTLNFGPRPDATFQQAMSRLGEYEMQRTHERVATVWQNGGVLSNYKIPNENDKIRCRSLLSGGRAVVGCSYGLFVYDARTARGIYSLPGHTDTVYGVAPSVSQRYLLTGARDHTLEIWNLETYEHLVSLFFAGNEWIAWTPQGYYACSVGGEALIGWHVNQGPDQLGQFYPVSRFRASHYRPDVIRGLLESQSVQRAVTAANSQRDQQSRPASVSLGKPPDVTITSPHPEAGELLSSPVTIAATAKSRSEDPIVALRVLVNGRSAEVRRYQAGPDNPSLEVSETFTLALPPGRHQVVVRADTSRSYDLSAPLDLTVSGDAAAESPVLYVLAIGGDPSASAGDVAVALSNDAAHIAKALEAHAAQAYSQVRVKSLSGSQATPAAVREGLDWLAANVKTNDAAIIYFAAQATTNDRGDVLLLASDPLRSQAALAGSELSSKLAAVRGRLLLWADWRSAAPQSAMKTIRDACLGDTTSGETSKQHSAGAAIDDLLRDLVGTDQGVAVISATSGTTAAVTPGTGTIGWFAQALAEAIAGRADADHNATVSLAELEEYVKSRVAELSGNRWRPNVGRSSLIPSIPISKP